jgi:predicted metalloprotease
MRWTPGSRDNIEDRRGAGIRGAAPLGIGGFLVLLVLSLIFKQNLFTLVSDVPEDPATYGTTSSTPPADTTPEEEQLVDFVSFVLNDAQDVWTDVFQRAGRTYEPAKLVLFRDVTPSACGRGQAAMGPFYCPGDAKVYLDLSFFNELQRRFGAPGDFAEAYVVAHEIGHHVQSLLGIDREVRQRQAARPQMANPLSVRLELQADCFAGIWGHSTARRDILERGDVEEALNAAAAIGDDRIQQEATGRVVPDAFTHGSSEQRVTWFNRGLQSGDMQACDTFSGS